MADGISIPGRRHPRRMRLVHAHLAELMIRKVNDCDFVRRLDHLYAEVPKDVRYSSRPTLVGWGWINRSGQRDFTVIFHDFCGFWLQDRIGIIADKLTPVATPVLRPATHAR